jgi:hypothetical protein
MTDDLVGRLRRDLASGLSASIGDTKDAADRIDKLEKYASLHAKCEQTSLEYEQKLVNRLRDAHKRIRQLEGILKRAVDGYVQANSVETLNFDWLDDAEAALKENSL